MKLKEITMKQKCRLSPKISDAIITYNYLILTYYNKNIKFLNIFLS